MDSKALTPHEQAAFEATLGGPTAAAILMTTENFEQGNGAQVSLVKDFLLFTLRLHGGEAEFWIPLDKLLEELGTFARAHES